MTRRGRCRCGYVLKFRKGPHGFKMRCPGCGSVVRLRVPEVQSSKSARMGIAQCSCGAEVEVSKGKTTFCPRCRSAVAATKNGSRQVAAREDAYRATDFLSALDVEPVVQSEFEVLPPENEPPSEILPVSSAFRGDDQVVSDVAIPGVCRTCGVDIPVGRKVCPSCETRNHALLSLQGNEEEVEAIPVEEIPTWSWPSFDAIGGWLIYGALLVVVMVVVFLISILG